MSNEIKILPVLRFPEFEKGHGWEKIPLKQVLEIRNEQAPQSEDYPLMAFVKNEGVAPKGDRYNRDFLVHDKEGKKYKRTEYGDFIYSSNNLDTGSIGLNRYGSASISPVYSIFRVKHSADSEFIGRLLIRPSFVNKMLKFRQGVVYGQLKIHENDVLKIKVAIPSFQEQQKIASCLSSLDDLLAAHNDKLDALKDHKKGLLQNLFPQEGETVPKVRFPEFEGDGEWVERKLGEISHKIMVGIASAATQAYRKSGIMLFRNQNIKEGYLDDRDILYIDEEYEKAHKNKRLKAGDLLTARTGYPGTTCVVPKKYEGFQSFTTLITRPDNSIVNFKFLCLFINSEKGQSFFEATKIGGGQKNVNAGSLAEMPILFPSKKEQQKIASCLSAVDELITAQQDKIEQLQQHKKGLMQGLFPKMTD